ncbi:hypothetical protein D3C71_1044500 [compost metagenome]
MRIEDSGFLREADGQLAFGRLVLRHGAGKDRKSGKDDTGCTKCKKAECLAAGGIDKRLVLVGHF